MQILEPPTLGQIEDILMLMRGLDSSIPDTAEMLEKQQRLRKRTFLWQRMMYDGQFIGCASLCIFHSSTDRKASIEDVVVCSGSRRQGIERALIEHILGGDQREMTPVNLHLTLAGTGCSE